jgi:hypothetical protein
MHWDTVWRYPLLSAVCCLLSAVCRLLSAVCCLLSAVCRLLSAVYRLLSAVCCLPSAVCCLLSTVCCLLAALCLLFECILQSLITTFSTLTDLQIRPLLLTMGSPWNPTISINPINHLRTLLILLTLQPAIPADPAICHHFRLRLVWTLWCIDIFRCVRPSLPGID